MTVLKKTNILPLALAIAPARPAWPRHRPRSPHLASSSPPLVPPRHRHRPRSSRHAIAPARLATPSPPLASPSPLPPLAIAPARHRHRPSTIAICHTSYLHRCKLLSVPVERWRVGNNSKMIQGKTRGSVFVFLSFFANFRMTQANA